MPRLIDPPPYTPIDGVSDILHGISVADPYRWLEEQESPRTRAWISDQTSYARSYLDSIPGRAQIRDRVRQMLDVTTYDSFLKNRNRYFFRKRLPGQEQPSIYSREEAGGEDKLLVGPAARGAGNYTALIPRMISPNGSLLLYEVKQGGERMGTFEIVDIATGKILPDTLPHGYLRGFAFAPDEQSFYYVHDSGDSNTTKERMVCRHWIGDREVVDQRIFEVNMDAPVRLALAPCGCNIVLYIYHLLKQTLTDVYIISFDPGEQPFRILHRIPFRFDLRQATGRFLALTDCDAPNRRIVQIRLERPAPDYWTEIVPERAERIERWLLADESIIVSYRRHACQILCTFDLFGRNERKIPVESHETVRLIGGSLQGEEFLAEVESFTEPLGIFSYSAHSAERAVLANKTVPFDSSAYASDYVWYGSKGGSRNPMYLVGRRDVLAKRRNPTIMTSYGGFGVSMTPQFSVFVAFLMERGCLFALPIIRGGGEFGPAWREAGKRRNRQNAYDDFLAAAEALMETQITDRERLAIFGGSNSGLLVGAALTQRPDLFRAVVCMVPLLDMLRYHLFDNATLWESEFGTAKGMEDFQTLFSYSPYHQVRAGTAYPATLIVSGDADQNCNALHARKMTARLQAANSSSNPILLDYSPPRGHSPVMPLGMRIDALTDRMAFLCDQLGLPL